MWAVGDGDEIGRYGRWVGTEDDDNATGVARRKYGR
jgi:hypothetical protein